MPIELCQECRYVTGAHAPRCSVGKADAREARVAAAVALITAWELERHTPDWDVSNAYVAFAKRYYADPVDPAGDDVKGYSSAPKPTT